MTMTYKDVDENGGQIVLIHGALDGAGIAKTDDDGRTYSSFGRVTVALAENGRLRERVELLKAAATAAHLEMVAMGNRLNWDMTNHGFPPPYHFPVTFTNAINQLRELTAEGGE